ncbi:ribokinase [Enterococcus thailandicus]|uniref:Ribokinase n=1 Tax=Enterococcus thailandicus TaxID=417368 RepID=A0A510WCQ8_ENTTH|nr:ribokinase [Enterococcus thailandicus]MDK4353412.1 ribokinase [Enterococcus thailandicus]MDT2735386.1 ribokinase [Enterococcus thailandicus]MDT2751662.1 ribokinase [Enterococcus thailandicus]MDT2776230.1 ribokinase [Enterococcus thailandicus]MDT2795060.1 ribokinase [Enterococcus thailandicus]
MNAVTVIGSINMDTTLRLTKMPKPGETLHTSDIFHSGGGKGANQAVAAKRSGANTAFIGAVGDDNEGATLLDLLAKEQIDISGISTIADTATGQAMIMVDNAGENSILIHAGANNAFHEAEVQQQKALIENSDFLIAQFESSLDATLAAFTLAKKAGKKTILNPAPALETIPTELLAQTDVIIPNETETEIITGIEVTDEASLFQAATALHQLGIETVIITLGSKGAFYHTATQHGIVPAFKVKAVDTTAAGDTFIGALSSQLNPDFSNLPEAIRYGNLASSVAVQSYGAQPSIPHRTDLTFE